ncbi:hypothetical protein F2Q69_00024944 [Brassica cretica]|uniref:Uncharacterized protein n=1 Tax=Brassica cretica TaxID=69181 RepID=A0A8S9Q9W6_BRACR|nr:hypothetical protein F2Q69_00024944 [Brassica cretica]
MLHKIWAAISRIRPCRCRKDDVVHQDNSPSSSGSGSSDTRRASKRSKRPEDAGTSGAGGEDYQLQAVKHGKATNIDQPTTSMLLRVFKGSKLIDHSIYSNFLILSWSPLKDHSGWSLRLRIPGSSEENTLLPPASDRPDCSTFRGCSSVPTPVNALIDKPSFFTPKYHSKGKAVDDEKGEDEAAQAVPNDDSQPHQLLLSDSSQPCRCRKDDVVHQDNSTSSSGSGSSDTCRASKRSKRPEDAGTSGAGGEDYQLQAVKHGKATNIDQPTTSMLLKVFKGSKLIDHSIHSDFLILSLQLVAERMDRAKKTLYCHLPQIGLTSLLSEAAVEFLPPATALVDKPSFFTPKYQTKGKGVVDEEGEDEAAQAIPDDSQPHQLLPSDSSQYKLQELPPNATSRQQQHWRDQSIKTNNDMLHKIWAAISRIRPCRCQKDDVVHRDNSPSSSGSGSSGTHRARKRSKRPEYAGTSGAGDEE